MTVSTGVAIKHSCLMVVIPEGRNDDSLMDGMLGFAYVCRKKRTTKADSFS